MTTELRAGVARADITPPVGISLVGFAGRGPAEGIHDALYATTLALECDGARALIVTADLLYFGDRLAAEVRGEIERSLGVPADHVLLCASHTHYGPSVGAHEPGELPEDVAAYLAHLKFVLAGTARAALAECRPVLLGTADGACPIGVNRRERRADGRIILGQNPEGPCDREVRLARLDTAEGRPLAALVHVACHPVSAAGAMRMISADFVAPMRQLVESFTGATCLFLQGAAGNINPIEMRHSFEPARRLGVMLGGEAAKLHQSVVPQAATGLRAAATHLDLPSMTVASIEEGERAVAELQAEVERLRDAAPGSLWWAEQRLRRAQGMLDAARTGGLPPPVPAELCCLRFGDVALATAPAELFTETGMEIKRRSPLPCTLPVGYTNGSIGYVPIPAAYPEGGYEVTHACRVGPEAAGIIAETLVAQLAATARSAASTGSRSKT